MKDLRNTKIDKKINFKKFYLFLFKNKYKILIILIILLIIFFPKISGTLIGTWISKFIGSLINNIKI